MAQPTYPHDIKKTYVWWIERGQLAVAYHDLDDSNGGRNGEFISPIVGYDAKITASTIAISDNGGNILVAKSLTNSKRIVSLLFQIELSDNSQLETIISDAKEIENVFDVKRVFPGKRE